MKKNSITIIILLVVIASLIGVLIGLYKKPAGEKDSGVPNSPPLYTPTDEAFPVNLYFAGSGRGLLTAEQRNIFRSSERINQIKQTLIELFKGPTQLTLVSAMPEGTQLREVYMDQQGILYVDCSAEIQSKHSGGTNAELLTVYSIVNTIMKNFEEIKGVKIIVAGEAKETLAGHIDLSNPFTFEANLVE